MMIWNSFLWFVGAMVVYGGLFIAAFIFLFACLLVLRDSWVQRLPFFLRDRYGWPLEQVMNKPVLNFFRRLFITNIRMTWKYRNGGSPRTHSAVDCCAV